MTVEDVERFIADRIVTQAGDDEVQHFEEDTLYEMVLGAIGGGVRNAAELARAALKTRDLHFIRWYSS